MDHPLNDERIQFFLRHRDDIRAWAAIERELPAIVREMLASCQEHLDEQLASLDPAATTSRRDAERRWERILVRRPFWPDGVGVSLEWEVGVDPFGSLLPKIGVIFLSNDPAVDAIRLRLIETCEKAGTFQAHGYKVNAEPNWPLLRRVDASRDWWKDPQAWTAAIVDRVVDLWQRSAALIDQTVTTSGVQVSR